MNKQQTILGLTPEQIEAIKASAKYLEANKEVLDPDSWKRGTIKWNYVIAAIPTMWGLGSAFGIDVHLSANQATFLLQATLFVLPIVHNVILAITSKHITWNPFTIVNGVITNIKRRKDD